jgi:cell division protease FtsH
MKQSKVKALAMWAVIVALLLVLLQLSDSGNAVNVSYSDFISYVDQGQIASVRVDGNVIYFELWGGAPFQTLGVMDDDMTRRLSEQGVPVAWGPPEKGPMRTILIVGLPLVIFLGLFLYFLRKMQGGTNSALELRKSRAKLISKKVAARFEDVGGCDEAKQQLADVVDFLRHPERWRKAGVRLPRGLLLEGPPGCGKTLLARAVAGETDAKFFTVSASEFVEMFVGVGAARVRDLFEQAAREAPAVIFIDELDAIGRKRGSGVGLVNDEREHTLNQLLVSLDGFDRADELVVIAASNRSDILDTALLRPGRFDRRIAVSALSPDARVAVLKIHCRGKSVSEDLSFERIADLTDGFSGADLEGLINEAGLRAVRRVRDDDDSDVTIAEEDFLAALDPKASMTNRFDQVDSLLIESTTQLSQPTGGAIVRLTLHEGTVVEGELVWANAAFVKLRTDERRSATIVPKVQIKTIEPLSGTEALAPDDLQIDVVRKLDGGRV